MNGALFAEGRTNLALRSKSTEMLPYVFHRVDKWLKVLRDASLRIWPFYVKLCR